MPRPRNTENRSLPARWRVKHGAYYFQVPAEVRNQWNGKTEFRLGKTLSEAYRTWSERMGKIDSISTVGALLDRYALQVIPTKATTTQVQNISAMRPVHSVFKDVNIEDVKPRHIYAYAERRGGGTGVKREIEILSHAFTKAVEWGLIDRHPFKGQVILKGEKARMRYVEDWEVVECLSLEPKRASGGVLAVQAYIRLKLLTGMRKGDLLRLTMSDLKADGIHYTPGKTAGSTGKQIILSWSNALRSAVDEAKSVRPRSLSPFLFCNSSGECYFKENGRPGGWDSLWRDFMDRVLEETKLKERFTDHDLRAKCASDASSLEHAQALLAHADSRLTERVYRRKATVVNPAA